MWNRREGPARPERVSVTADGTFIRRNIALVEAAPGEDKEPTPILWTWEELRVPPDAWAICRKVLGHDEALDDVYAALTELAGIIEEG